MKILHILRHGNNSICSHYAFTSHFNHLQRHALCSLQACHKGNAEALRFKHYKTSKDNLKVSISNYMLIGTCVASSALALWLLFNSELSAEEPPEINNEAFAATERTGLPTYSAEEVAAHDTADKRIWVYFKSGVYDITDFISIHPGGEKILMAAGSSLEPFWETFPVHKSIQVNVKRPFRKIYSSSAE